MKLIKVFFLLISLLWIQPTFVYAQEVEDETLLSMRRDLNDMKDYYNQKKNDFDKEKGNMPESIRNRRQQELEEWAKRIQIAEEDIQKYIDEKNKNAVAQKEEDNGKEINPDQTYYRDRGDWQIVNPEYTMMGIGEHVKITFKGENYRIILYDNGGSAGEELINGKKDKLYIYGSKGYNSNNIGIFGAESLPLQDIYKIIKEKLLPLVHVDNDNYLSVYNGSTDNYIGSLSKSGFKTKAQMNQMDKDREQAKRQALNKKYGKVYVDAINNNKLMVGMPIKLLINDATWVNVYKMYMYNNGESGQFKVDILVEGTASNGWSSGAGVYHRTYRVWVKNWKITQFRNWTNADEREFNRL